ncbi:unnamed protein product, partial [Durusdinium trenchii]
FLISPVLPRLAVQVQVDDLEKAPTKRCSAAYSDLSLAPFARDVSVMLRTRDRDRAALAAADFVVLGASVDGELQEDRRGGQVGPDAGDPVVLPHRAIRWSFRYRESAVSGPAKRSRRSGPTKAIGNCLKKAGHGLHEEGTGHGFGWKWLEDPGWSRDARLGSGLPGARGLESGLYGLSLSESQAGYPIGVMDPGASTAGADDLPAGTSSAAGQRGDSAGIPGQCDEEEAEPSRRGTASVARSVDGTEERAECLARLLGRRMPGRSPACVRDRDGDGDVYQCVRARARAGDWLEGVALETVTPSNDLGRHRRSSAPDRASPAWRCLVRPGETPKSEEENIMDTWQPELTATSGSVRVTGLVKELQGSGALLEDRGAVLHVDAASVLGRAVLQPGHHQLHFEVRSHPSVHVQAVGEVDGHADARHAPLRLKARILRVLGPFDLALYEECLLQQRNCHRKTSSGPPLKNSGAWRTIDLNSTMKSNPCPKQKRRIWIKSANRPAMCEGVPGSTCLAGFQTVVPSWG